MSRQWSYTITEIQSYNNNHINMHNIEIYLERGYAL